MKALRRITQIYSKTSAFDGLPRKTPFWVSTGSKLSAKAQQGLPVFAGARSDFPKKDGLIAAGADIHSIRM
jgi:hypothetical protein